MYVNDAALQRHGGHQSATSAQQRSMHRSQQHACNLILLFHLLHSPLLEHTLQRRRGNAEAISRNERAFSTNDPGVQMGYKLKWPDHKQTQATSTSLHVHRVAIITSCALIRLMLRAQDRRPTGTSIRRVFLTSISRRRCDATPVSSESSSIDPSDFARNFRQQARWSFTRKLAQHSHQRSPRLKVVLWADFIRPVLPRMCQTVEEKGDSYGPP